MSDNLSNDTIREEKSLFSKIPWRGILTLFGAFLIQLTLGSFYSFGNMMTYMTSYMREHGSPEITYADVILVQSVWGMTQGISMPISGFVIRITGPRAAMFGGCLIFSLGAASTYFTINQNVWAVAFTYGFVSAFGQGIALIPTMTISMKWFPKRKGMAMGVVVGGFGGGAFIFNQIQTAILNPDNVKIDSDSGYFTDPELLARVPTLMLILGLIYFSISFLACLMISDPPGVCPTSCGGDEASSSSTAASENDDEAMVLETELNDDDDEMYTSVKDAFMRRELYILWLTRFCVVLITQLVAGFYKAFGQTFIQDDHFLSFVGAICSIFNCSGRLFYGLLMDKTCYRTAMIIEAVFLAIFVATFFVTTYAGKAMFAIWIWAIFFTFPGTFAMMPAATIQAFGHKHGGTIYGIFFSSDIPNNLLLWIFSKMVLKHFGWLGMFLIPSGFAIVALVSTLMFPKYPTPLQPSGSSLEGPRDSRLLEE